MIHRALRYVLRRRLVNWLRQLIRRPATGIGMALFVGLFALLAFQGGLSGRAQGIDRTAALGVLLSIYMVLSFLSGLSSQGLGFTPADLDWVFPGPFRRRDVLVYHLTTQYLGAPFLALLWSAVMGLSDLPNPGWTFLGMTFVLIVCTHLQTLGSLLAGAIGDHVFSRLKRAVRVLIVLALLAGLALIFAVMAKADVAFEIFGKVMNSGAAKVLLYPAVAVRALAVETGAGRWLHLGGLLLSVVGSFGVLLLFRWGFEEASYVRTRKLAEARSGRRKVPERASSRVAQSALFRGAGAIAWVNLLTLRRRLRILVGAGLVLAIWLFAVGGGARSTPGAPVPAILPLLFLFPLLFHLPLGFRGHREHLTDLKALPLAPSAVAAAELAVPVVLIAVVQVGLLVVYAVLGAVEPRWVLVALAACPVVNVTVLAVAEIFQMGRAPNKPSMLVAMLQMLTAVACFVPAIFALVVVLKLFGSRGGAIVTGVTVQAAVAGLLVFLLGLRFARFDMSRAEVG